VPGPPHPPASEELAWLRARVAELEAVNARLREAARARDELAAAQLAALAAQVEELRRRLGKDSSTSSKPPSSDSPYTKKPKDRSLRGRSGRKPGKQPGAQSSTLRQSPDPGKTVVCGPGACGCCGHDLSGEPVLGVPQKRQVFEVSPPLMTLAESPQSCSAEFPTLLGIRLRDLRLVVLSSSGQFSVCATPR
jgi:transposase